MHELLTPQEMGRADALAIAGGVPGIDLMEAAGKAVAEAAARLAPEGPVLVVAGPGNNGGDGYVAARLLRAHGRDVRVVLIGDPARIRGDAALARARWTGPEIMAATPLPEASLIIDALFGAGLDRDVTGEPADLVAAMNRSPATRLAVDVPSGLDGRTGRIIGCAVEADATVTFFRKKPGHLLEPGRSLCGRLTLAQIGIPASVLAEIRPGAFENLPALWSEAFPRVGRAGHKYDRGHALVVSGPMLRTGAARLAAGAALRAGAGLVTLASPADALAVNASHLTAVMLRRVDTGAALSEVLSDARFTAVGLGPGLGTGAREQDLVLAVLGASPAAVLDADALTAFAAEPNRLFGAIRDREADVILTPHAGEFARLFPDLTGPAHAKADRARDAAKRSGAVMVLKGADTVIAAPDGRTAINANAPPWLATAGSGDVLTGIATGLAAQGMPAFKAACAAVWLHGDAASEAGPGLVAEDLSPALRPVLARFSDRR
jgi:ADP-dependent NAD(P)H-hydrate dehydratase / NAD(P)H-hydrate epimerase